MSSELTYACVTHTHTDTRTHIDALIFVQPAFFGELLQFGPDSVKEPSSIDGASFFSQVRCPSCHPTYHVEAQVIGRHSKQRLQPKKIIHKPHRFLRHRMSRDESDAALFTPAFQRQNTFVFYARHGYTTLDLPFSLLTTYT